MTEQGVDSVANLLSAWRSFLGKPDEGRMRSQGDTDLIVDITSGFNIRSLDLWK